MVAEPQAIPGLFLSLFRPLGYIPAFAPFLIQLPLAGMHVYLPWWLEREAISLDILSHFVQGTYSQMDSDR